MRHLVVITAALAVMAQAPLASASSCQGSSTTNYSGNYCPGNYSGGSSGSYVYLGHTVSVAPQCEDETDVIGYRRCTKFGAWGHSLELPNLAIEAGVVTRQFGTLLNSQTGTVLHGVESFAFRVMGGQAQTRPVDTAVLTSLRASVALSHGMYTALEVDLGGLAQPGQTPTEMMSSGVFGTPELQQERGLLVDSLATVGVRAATHAGAISAELAGGVRYASYSFHSSYHQCEQSVSIKATEPLAEARVRGELWVTPWLTAGLTVGTSVIERHTWMGGLYLGVHTHAFGGER